MTVIAIIVLAAMAHAQEILHVPPASSGSTAGLKIQDLSYKKCVELRNLTSGVPNILIGGVTSHLNDGFLCCEFNLPKVQRTKARCEGKHPRGKVNKEVQSKLAAKIGEPIDITLKLDGMDVARGQVPEARSLHFASSATLDIGTDLIFRRR